VAATGFLQMGQSSLERLGIFCESRVPGTGLGLGDDLTDWTAACGG